MTDNAAFREGIEARSRMIDSIARFEAALLELKASFDSYEERHPKEDDDA